MEILLWGLLGFLLQGWFFEYQKRKKWENRYNSLNGRIEDIEDKCKSMEWDLIKMGHPIPPGTIPDQVFMITEEP